MVRAFLIALIALVSSPSIAGDVDDAVAAAKTWRQANERQIIDDYSALLSIPNVATNIADIERNAEHIVGLLEPRGFTTKILRAGGAPSVYAERKTPGAEKTLLLYAHYDGQAVDPSTWANSPWEPTMRDGIMGEIVDLDAHTGPMDPEWRLYARSAGDDKAPITVLTAALDALAAAGMSPNVNIKLFLEGEEERSSPTLRGILEAHADLLDADMMIFGDGPMHQSRRSQLVFGVRGSAKMDLTVYGPARPLHSGHYGNWAPNPGVMLMELLTSMRDSDGKILIDGYMDAVTPITDADRAAIAAMPDSTKQIMEELAIGRAEGGGARLEELLLLPAFNVRGLQMGGVGKIGRNVIETDAQASIDFRLAPNLTPLSIRPLVEAHIRKQGFHIVNEPADLATRAAHEKVIYVDWPSGGYPAWRTPVDSPGIAPLIGVLRQIHGDDLVLLPSYGASIPMYLFDEFLGDTPIVMFAIANHDNNQHARNENMRLQNLWDAIEAYAAILAGLYEAP